MTDSELVALSSRYLSMGSTSHAAYLRDEEQALLQYLGIADPAQLGDSSSSNSWQSNINVLSVITFSHVEAIHSRLLFALSKSFPWVRYSSQNSEAATQANQYCNEKLRSEVPIENFCDNWVRSALIPGKSTVKICWEEDRRVLTDLWSITIPPDYRDRQDDPTVIDALITEKLTKKVKEFRVLSRKSSSWRVEYYRSGALVTSILSYSVKDGVIKVLLKRLETTFKGVRPYIISAGDIFKGFGPIQTCSHVIHRIWLTWPQVVDRVISGQFTGIDISDNSPDKQFFSEQTIQAEQGGRLAAIRAEFAGQTPILSTDKYYEFLECYMLVPSTDDFAHGALEDRIISVFRKKNTVVRNKSRTEEGMDYRPFATINIHEVPGEPDSAIGIAAMVRELAREEGVVHNLILNSSILAANKLFFYDAHAKQKKEKIEILPGVGIPFDCPDSDIRKSVYIPEFGANLQPLFAMAPRLEQLSMSVTGVGETQLQQKPSQETLGQSTIAQNELNIRFSRIASKTFGSTADVSGIAGFILIICSLYKRYGEEMQVVSESGVESSISFPDISSSGLKINIDISKLNTEMEIERTNKLFTILMNPGLQQLGVSNANSVRAVVKELILLLNKDPSHYLPVQQEGQGQPMNPDHENTLLAQGVMVPVHPADDDMAHNLSHDTFESALKGMPELNINSSAFKQHRAMHKRNALVKRQQSVEKGQLPGMGLQSPLMGGGVSSPVSAEAAPSAEVPS